MQNCDIDINSSGKLLLSLLHGLSEHVDPNLWMVVQSSHFLESIMQTALLLKEIQLYILLHGWIEMCKLI